jgi:hypothetical protein
MLDIQGHDLPAFQVEPGRLLQVNMSGFISLKLKLMRKRAAGMLAASEGDTYTPIHDFKNQERPNLPLTPVFIVIEGAKHHVSGFHRNLLLPLPGEAEEKKRNTWAVPADQAEQVQRKPQLGFKGE